MDDLFMDEDGELCLCPSCATPLTERLEVQRLAAYRKVPNAPTSVACPTCGADLTADAPTSAPPARAAQTRPCVACAATIRALARRCHACRAPQPR